MGIHIEGVTKKSVGSVRAPSVNHALIARSSFIIQTYVPVSLEIKDTVVRSYRTDPVQTGKPLMVLSTDLNSRADFFWRIIIKIQTSIGNGGSH
ncbi:hypothetical protein MTR_7g089250 [Medicago truncatula]|uniref:Uncharacterized protein n=1 Tax=Medicago truncatula TaxID=3880 RepID=G7L5W4_MEDTR|nr:hypothetical protein MTR_7g089250 [Medicago truncatula]